MIGQRIEEIRNELSSLDDAFLQYSFLVELSSYVSPHQPELMTDAHLHHGCQSRVWTEFCIKDGQFYMNATSDTLLIRGVLYILMELFNGLSPEEIAETKPDFLKECGISHHFSGERISGLNSVTDSIYAFCRRAAESGKKG